MFSGITELLEGGGALVVGSVDDAGAPWAGRGWGVEVLAPTRFRVLMDPSDLAPGADRPGAPVAVTASDVRTLRSVQVKGTVVDVGPTGPGDDERRERYRDRVFGDIVDTDGIALELLERFVPTRYVSCTVEVSEVFDQTPGPGAGAALTEAGQ